MQELLWKRSEDIFYGYKSFIWHIFVDNKNTTIKQIIKKLYIWHICENNQVVR